MALAQTAGLTIWVNSRADTTNSTNSCGTAPSIDRGPSTAADTCTLPDAINAATAYETANPDTTNTIDFTVCGPYVITTQLPAIPANTITTAQSVSDVAGDGPDTCFDNGALSPNYGYANVEGSGAGPNGAAQFAGITLQGAGTVLNGLGINGFTDGVVMAPPGGDEFFYSFVGANPFEQGYLFPPNTGNGIEVQAGSANDVIGYAPSAGDNNQEADDYGNAGWGIYLDSGSGPTTVGDMYIGTDTTGHQLGPGSEGYTDFNNNDAALPGNGPSDGNGLGGVYVGDDNGDVIGGSIQCQNAGMVCNSNVIANNGGPGVEIGPGAGNATVAGNFIGPSLDFYGSTETVDPVCGQESTNDCPAPNEGAGVLDRGANDMIGGSAASDGNMISGNDSAGVLLEGTRATVENNQIGVDLTGQGAEPNQGPGVQTSDAGGTASGQNTVSGNVISGNIGAGVELDQAGNTVANNFIGVGGDHTTAVPNALGILIQRGTQTIGAVGQSPNTIADNTGAGIAVVDPGTGSHTAGVSVYDNSIFGNGGLGIDLGNDGVTANSAASPSPGPDSLQTYPTLTSASSANGQYEIRGTITTVPNIYVAIQAYASGSCDPSGYGQGQRYLTSGQVSTNAAGQANFALQGSGLSPGESVSATALGFGPGDGTSEFSRCVTTTAGDDLKVSQFIPAYGTAIANEPIDVDIHIANGGPADATNVVLTDTLPQNATLVSQPAGCPAASGGQFKCTIGAIDAGAALDVHVLIQPGNVSSLTNTAQADADQIQTTAGDNVSTFTTPVTPNPANQNQNPSSVNVETPSFGQYVRLDRESGTISATLPNGQVIALQNFAIVPVGTVVQASSGVARVTAALPGSGDETSFSDFYQGRFKIAQNRKAGGLVTAVMDGSLAGCSSKRRGRRDHASRAHAASSKGTQPTGPTKRHLWGHAHGQYTIQGGRGSATVHGTIWEVIDTCNKTTVKVKTDVVDVRAIGRNVPKFSVVHAGHKVVLHAPGA